MNAVAFDTLKFAQNLRDKANFSSAQAEGLSEAFSEAISGQLVTRADLIALATKDDMSALKDDISGLIDDVSALKDDVSELKTDVSELKTDVSTLKTDVSTLKTDVSALKTDVSMLKDDVSALKFDLAAVKGSVSAVKDDVRRVEGKIDASKVETLRWIVGAIGFQTIAMMATVFGLVRFIVH